MTKPSLDLWALCVVTVLACAPSASTSATPGAQPTWREDATYWARETAIGTRHRTAVIPMLTGAQAAWDRQ